MSFEKGENEREATKSLFFVIKSKMKNIKKIA